MAVEQREPSAGTVSEYEFGILEHIVDRCFLPRQRGGTAASRRARAEAECVAALLRLARSGRTDMEGAGE
jgi:hypothetical protein